MGAFTPRFLGASHSTAFQGGFATRRNIEEIAYPVLAWQAYLEQSKQCYACCSCVSEHSVAAAFDSERIQEFPPRATIWENPGPRQYKGSVDRWVGTSEGEPKVGPISFTEKHPLIPLGSELVDSTPIFLVRLFGVTRDPERGNGVLPTAS